MSELSPIVESHIARLFRPKEQSEVAHLLANDCGTTLAGAENASLESLARIQCAALKLSGGSMDKLYDAIALAQTDWRDLLVAADFAQDTQANGDWKC
ncbi:MAG: hypothetical protein HKN28_01335 [Alphaproteobacteria bacterium]|nr:hypothetical protein [Alphaproteobacteria bacterium]